MKPTIRVVLLVGALLACTPLPAQAGAPRVTVLAHGFGQPDDLAWGPHGAIYFSDFGNSAVNVLLPNGQRRVVRAGLSAPEGIVVQRDGSLVVAEQGPNSLVRIDPTHGTMRMLATIPNLSTRSGIDGIALDARDGSIIVPDSPSGRILRISPSGKVRVVAGGLGRPVGAIGLDDGSIMVVDEHLNGAFRISPQGTAQQIGGFLSVPDDIVSDGQGGFYITCLGDNTLRHLDRRGVVSLVAAGLRNPQGLLRRSDGALIVSQEDANLIVVVRP